MGYRLGWTWPPGLSNSAVASASSARRNGCKDGKRLKNSSPVTARRADPPALGATWFMYPHTLVNREAKESVAALRTCCGERMREREREREREGGGVEGKSEE